MLWRTRVEHEAFAVLRENLGIPDDADLRKIAADIADCLPSPDDRNGYVVMAQSELDQQLADYNDCNLERALWRQRADKLEAVVRPLLESYLATFSGNKDQLALDAEALLTPSSPGPGAVREPATSQPGSQRRPHNEGDGTKHPDDCKCPNCWDY